MHRELSVALEPVLQDLETGCAVPPDIREADPGSTAWEGLAEAWLFAPDGTGRGISVVIGQSRAEQVAYLADQVQEWAVEELCSAGLPAVWPECPAHRNSHPLLATLHNDEAIWACPRTREPIAPIGRLPAVES
ncbi:hypothetical protein [Streptosporangium sp. NPDC000396]|uniref:hypothetical protein n=1 Tax=Streptosporangium sp. NPDC000396 TaxID=3366185 RepID=UPI0036A5609E